MNPTIVTSTVMKILAFNLKKK